MAPRGVLRHPYKVKKVAPKKSSSGPRATATCLPRPKSTVRRKSVFDFSSDEEDVDIPERTATIPYPAIRVVPRNDNKNDHTPLRQSNKLPPSVKSVRHVTVSAPRRGRATKSAPALLPSLTVPSVVHAAAAGTLPAASPPRADAPAPAPVFRPSRAAVFVHHAAVVLPKKTTVDDLRAVYPILKRRILPEGNNRCVRSNIAATDKDSFTAAPRSAKESSKRRPESLGVPVRSGRTGEPVKGGFPDAKTTGTLPRDDPLTDGTTDEESAAEERRVTNAEVLHDPVYSGRPRYEFPLFHRGSAMIPLHKVREGCEVTRSIVQTSIFSKSWLPVDVPDDIAALDPAGINELEELIRLGTMSLVVDKLNIFGLSAISDLAIGMSLYPNSTVRTTGSEFILKTTNAILLVHP